MEVFIQPFNFSFLNVTGWGIDLDYCDIEWFALEMNRGHSVVFEIASKYCMPLGTPLGLVHWKRASSPVEAGTAGYL